MDPLHLVGDPPETAPVYEAPNRVSAVLERLEAGTQVEIEPRESGWVRVFWEGGEGFMDHTDLLLELELFQ